MNDVYIIEYRDAFPDSTLVIPTNLSENWETYMKILATRDYVSLLKELSDCYKRKFNSPEDCFDLDILAKTFKYDIDFPELIRRTNNTKYVDLVIKLINNRENAISELGAGDDLLLSFFNKGLSIDSICALKIAMEERWLN